MMIMQTSCNDERKKYNLNNKIYGFLLVLIYETNNNFTWYENKNFYSKSYSTLFQTHTFKTSNNFIVWRPEQVHSQGLSFNSTFSLRNSVSIQTWIVPNIEETVTYDAPLTSMKKQYYIDSFLVFYLTPT